MADTTIPHLTINGVDARIFGVRMGENFISTLTEPLTPKEYIENESRMEHGKRIELANYGENPRTKQRMLMMASREVTLEFVIWGATETDFQANKTDFLDRIYAGAVDVAVPRVSADIYHLYYLGKGAEYNLNVSRTMCRMSLKFCEPNPMSRS